MDPASRTAPPRRRSLSVNVVLPASGWDIMAKVRLFLSSLLKLPGCVTKLIFLSNYRHILDHNIEDMFCKTRMNKIS